MNAWHHCHVQEKGEAPTLHSARIKRNACAAKHESAPWTKQLLSHFLRGMSRTSKVGLFVVEIFIEQSQVCVSGFWNSLLNIMLASQTNSLEWQHLDNWQKTPSSLICSWSHCTAHCENWKSGRAALFCHAVSSWKCHGQQLMKCSSFCFMKKSLSADNGSVMTDRMRWWLTHQLTTHKWRMESWCIQWCRPWVITS